jgi:hypothetical protein
MLLKLDSPLFTGLVCVPTIRCDDLKQFRRIAFKYEHCESITANLLETAYCTEIR